MRQCHLWSPDPDPKSCYIFFNGGTSGTCKASKKMCMCWVLQIENLLWKLLPENLLVAWNISTKDCQPGTVAQSWCCLSNFFGPFCWWKRQKNKLHKVPQMESFCYQGKSKGIQERKEPNASSTEMYSGTSQLQLLRSQNLRALKQWQLKSFNERAANVKFWVL